MLWVSSQENRMTPRLVLGFTFGFSLVTGVVFGIALVLAA